MHVVQHDVVDLRALDTIYLGMFSGQPVTKFFSIFLILIRKFLHVVK